MIDIHCHILHGIDDGAADLQESIEMARLAYDDGIRHIIATPHFNENYHNIRELVTTQTEQLQKTLDRLKISIQLYPGNEVRLEHADDIYKHAEHKHFCFLGPQEKFILLEQRWLSYNEDSLEAVKWFLDHDVIPVIPHPERHHFFRDKPDLLIQLVEAGAWTQVSVDSLLGKNSDETQAYAEWLVKEDLAHTLATDAHNTKRKPNLSEGFRIVKKLAGIKAVQDIENRLQRIIAE